MIGVWIKPAVSVARGHAQQVSYGHRLGARCRRISQFGQVHQDWVVQGEQPVVGGHSDGERGHCLRYREPIPTDVGDPATLSATAALAYDVHSFDAEPPVIGDLAKSVERRLQTHYLMLDHFS